MAPLPQQSPDAPPSPYLTAGLLLAARPHLARLGFPHPTVESVLAATGAGRARGYELKDAIEAMLPTLLRPVGRPPSAPAAPVDTSALTEQVLSFCFDHPGCVWGTSRRRRYSDDFRCFVLDLRAEHGELEHACFARAIKVPLPTLEEWLREARPPRPSTGAAAAAAAAGTGPSGPQIESILFAWKDWSGPFTEFVEHVNKHLHIAFRHTTIASILFVHGARTPLHRDGRSPDEKALRGAFETFFAGAQWVGDGSGMPVEINGERFAFNIELEVDAHTGAFVGASVRDEEDGQAVMQAFQDGVETTGAPPLAQLLDNRACNDTPDVSALLADNDTILLHATKGRPQNDAHVEGAFGLFKTTVPPIVIQASTPHELARSILMLMVMVWGRTGNHRPRKDRNGRSRFDLYQVKATPEQVQAARKALEERLRKQKRAQETLKARQDPIVRAILDDAFGRLGLEDPTGNLRSAISRYPLHAVLAGLAVFRGKRVAGTLPPNVDGRYLLAIVKNVSEKDEGIAIAKALWDLRLQARELIFTMLEGERDAALAQIPEPAARVKTCADRALGTECQIERTFWLEAVAEVVLAEPPPMHEPLFQVAARRIHGAFRVPHMQRLDATRVLASKILPTP